MNIFLQVILHYEIKPTSTEGKFMSLLIILLVHSLNTHNEYRVHWPNLREHRLYRQMPSSSCARGKIEKFR